MNHPELGNHSCVIRTPSGEIITSGEQGIRPPLLCLRENPVILKDAVVSDKVIGKAAALLFAYGGVRSIWAQRMSEAAIAFLTNAGIAFDYAERVEVILNRDGSDICPMERRALGIDSPAEAFRVFNEVIA